jgi:hypothetical protein
MRMTHLISPEQDQTVTCFCSRKANNLHPFNQIFFKCFWSKTGLTIVLRIMSKWIMAVEGLLKFKNTFIHHITAIFYNTKQNSLCSLAITLKRSDIWHIFCGKALPSHSRLEIMGVIQYNKHEWILQKCTVAGPDCTVIRVRRHLDRKTKMLLWKQI